MIERFPDSDEAVAYSVLQELQTFISEFEDRTTDSAALERILKGEDLVGGVVQQKPEFFTEQYLIVPLLRALGYKDVRWRPAKLIEEEQKQPDFQIDDPPARTLCIVEAKRLGREEREGAAAAQIKGYLQDDTFVKYTTNQKLQYLVGIGTDGIDWVLYGKPIGQREPSLMGEMSIRSQLTELTYEHRRETPQQDHLTPKLRQELCTSFVAAFSKQNLLPQLDTELDCPRRFCIED